MADVRLDNVTKSFGKVNAVKNISLSINNGDFVVLLGPTGAGKTTTLRIIAGLESSDEGQVFINDRSVNEEIPAQRDVAMVFQQYSLYPHLTVAQNLEFPLKSPILNWPQKDIDKKVTEVAEVLRISGKLNNKATELSGGEMQRVSIGRALVRNPSIYLMDEPLSSLDAKLRDELRLELKRLQSELGATVLYVTHDQTEAMTLATQVGVLDEGRLVQFGTPREIYENPSSIYVATRLGLPRINTLPCSVLQGQQNSIPERATTIGLRPEHIELIYCDDASRNHPGALSSTVKRIEHLGDQTRLHLRVSEHDVVTLADKQRGIKVGNDVHIKIDNPLYFDQYGQRVQSLKEASHESIY